MQVRIDVDDIHGFIDEGNFIPDPADTVYLTTFCDIREVAKKMFDLYMDEISD